MITNVIFGHIKGTHLVVMEQKACAQEYTLYAVYLFFMANIKFVYYPHFSWLISTNEFTLSERLVLFNQ